MFGEYGPDMWYAGLALGYAVIVWIAVDVAVRRGLPLSPPPRSSRREFERVS